MRSIWIGFAAAGLAALVSTAPAGAKETQDIIAMSAMSQDVRVYVAKTGGEVVSHIEKAQKLAATSTDFTAAAVEVSKALTLLESVAATSPHQSFKQKVGDLLHRHRAKKAKPEDMIPVEGVLNDIKQVNGAEVADVSTKLERVKGKLEDVSTVDSEADLMDASESIGYLEIDLPVQATKTRLMRAHIALLSKDGAEANGALTEALESTKKWTAMAQVTAVEAGEESK